MNPDRELAGQVVLVTGAARNIGRAIAQALAEGGASVMVSTLNSHDELSQTVDSIRGAGGSAASCTGDVTDPEAVLGMVAMTIDRFGRLDALVNNAAVRAEQPFIGMAFQDWRRILSVILDGTFFCAQACVPHIVRAGGGSIVNIGGETGHSGAAGRAHVVTAKAGLAGMTKALALELAPHRITVNCVVPGRIETVRAANTATPSRHGTPPPIGRFGLPEEVAAMVSMLCGPRARYITGQAIHVNGGGWMP
ncbi:MAG: SDR family oxidoreductase [Betaproteobacteria bacterium]|nr:MAG: SDR family oxidoreductase [Betaproteobacteria bacterium]